ncbi:FMN-binding negative transcriptional regulator [Acidovorax sp. Root217]|uniref:FMN-binding negative transcriptional regulator n=1 Tax=Acidovorax sp. Root217 TaxID=1736492 RepID=UPI00070A1D29|nr:FMN-binding negative transcriptional regulator [Acidovorax sp. Root217]KRC24412.1 negative transcriptional regulator [Acidovorax sp. Root217]
MHTLPLFAENDPATLHPLMAAYPLATLVTTSAAGASDVHLLPLELHTPDGAVACLRGHVVRSHSLRQQMGEGDSLIALFQGPNAYISPRWYVNGQRSARLAPSWNYVAVQVRGRLRWVEDDPEWVLAHLTALTAAQEASRVEPWSLDMAAPDYVEGAARHLVGFEIEITALEGKRFLSQQRTEADRRSLVEHLERELSGMARDVARLIVP